MSVLGGNGSGTGSGWGSKRGYGTGGGMVLHNGYGAGSVDSYKAGFGYGRGIHVLWRLRGEWHLSVRDVEIVRDMVATMKERERTHPIDIHHIDIDPRLYAKGIGFGRGYGHEAGYPDGVGQGFGTFNLEGDRYGHGYGCGRAYI